MCVSREAIVVIGAGAMGIEPIDPQSRGPCFSTDHTTDRAPTSTRRR